MSPARPLPLAGLVFAACFTTMCVTACSKERAVEAQGAAGDGCSRCHGTPELQGAPPPSLSGATSTDTIEVGAHVAHLTARRVAGPVACTECHVVPHDLNDPGHIDASGQKVVFGPVASVGGTPSWNRDQATCAVHCHGADLAGGSVAAPIWTRVDGSQITCGSCHGAPPPPPHPQLNGCAPCHPSTVRPDGSIDIEGGHHVDGIVDVSSGHPPGFSAPEVHGFAAKDNLPSCQSCHGEDFGGGVVGVSCNACHGGAQWQTNCTFCHGDKATGVSAPPRGTNGETATTARAVGAHQTHVTAGGTARAFGCDACHAPATSLAHVDGNPSPRFGTLSRTGQSNPQWNPATLTCSNVYCHGTTLAGGTLKVPKWTTVDGTQASCGACHGAPPPGPHPQNSSCGTCHTGYSATTVNAATHVDGTIQISDAACGACHGIPPPAPHIQSQACGSCHPGYTATQVVAATHMDGIVQVNTTCGSCHGIPPPTPHPPINTCATCHPGYTATQVVTATHMDGTVQVNTACGSCHGIPPPSPHPQITTCGSCHPGYTSTQVVAATHMDGRLQVNTTCGSCHGIPPPSPHPQIATCGACHPGYTATQVVAATHMDGTVQVNTTCGSCHGIPPPTPHPQINTCGSCHTGYTSTQVVAATHMDGTVQVNTTCGSCHGIPPPTPHPQINTCGSCHPGYTSTQVVAATHMDGTVQVNTTCGSCHGIPPPAPHPPITTCGTCHPGYTATQVVTATHMDGTLQVNTACGSCHGVPPPTAGHLRHDFTCVICHLGNTPTSTGPDHMNGTLDVTSPGWNPDGKTCTNVCHVTAKTWPG